MRGIGLAVYLVHDALDFGSDRENVATMASHTLEKNINVVVCGAARQEKRRRTYPSFRLCVRYVRSERPRPVHVLQRKAEDSLRVRDFFTVLDIFAWVVQEAGWTVTNKSTIQMRPIKCSDPVGVRYGL